MTREGFRGNRNWFRDGDCSTRKVPGRHIGDQWQSGETGIYCLTSLSSYVTLLPTVNTKGNMNYLYGKEVAPNEKVVTLADAELMQKGRDIYYEEVQKLKEEIRRLKNDKLPQRQDSLDAQLADLIPLATKAGCYDAADYLRDIVARHNKG